MLPLETQIEWMEEAAVALTPETWTKYRWRDGDACCLSGQIQRMHEDNYLAYCDRLAIQHRRGGPYRASTGTWLNSLFGDERLNDMLEANDSSTTLDQLRSAVGRLAAKWRLAQQKHYEGQEA